MRTRKTATPVKDKCRGFNAVTEVMRLSGVGVQLLVL
jgi:hypothetical protein